MVRFSVVYVSLLLKLVRIEDLFPIRLGGRQELRYRLGLSPLPSLSIPRRLQPVMSGSGLREAKEEVAEFIRSFFEVGKSKDSPR